MKRFLILHVAENDVQTADASSVATAALNYLAEGASTVEIGVDILPGYSTFEATHVCAQQVYMKLTDWMDRLAPEMRTAIEYEIAIDKVSFLVKITMKKTTK